MNAPQEPFPIVLVVFEGLIGITPAAEPKKRLRLRRRQRISAWDYTINPYALQAAQDAFRHDGPGITVVTFLGDEFAQEVKDVLDDAGFLCNGVLSTTCEALAHTISWRPEIVAVHDPAINHAWTYGARGRHTPPDAAAIIGRVA